MIVIPAIDLKDHKVVRLKQGRMEDSTIYSDSPVDIAKQWYAKGVRRLHMVDLNGAFAGSPVHAAEVKAVIEALPDFEIEIGGGIRSLESIETYLRAGARYCILGTIALKSPAFLNEACAKYPDSIILGLDAKDGYVATEGWGEVSQKKATDFIKECEGLKIQSVIYTDIARDGMLKGMNIPAIAEMAAQSTFPIIASGGLTSLDDIKALKKIKNIEAVIAGKALYEGNLELSEIIRHAN